MVMTMKKTTTLNMSVAESEAKLEGSASHPLVGGEETSTLMTRCIILAICSTNLRRTLPQKLSTHEPVKNLYHTHQLTGLLQVLLLLIHLLRSLNGNNNQTDPLLARKMPTA